MKTAFITGATSGIGLAFATQLSQQGYALVLHGRNQQKLQQLQAELPNVKQVLQADLSQPAQLEKMIAELEQSNLKIDIAINNAGFGLYGDHLTLEQSAIDEMIALNISAVTQLTRHFAAQMKQHGGGHIMNVASTAAYQPQPYMAAYAATKAYVSSFSEALSVELKSDNISVTCFSPGRTDTGFFTFDGQDTSKDSNGTFSKKHRTSPETVASIGLQAMFAGKLREIPMGINKFYVFLNRILPRKAVLAIYTKAMKAI